jgi:hypothetical protein
MAFSLDFKSTALGRGVISASNSYSGTLSLSLDETITNGQTAYEIDIAIDVSKVAAISISSNKAITLKTNSSGSPDNTLTLRAGVPYQWCSDSYDTFKLTTDVTKFYVANSSGASANLLLEGVVDGSP